VHPSDYWHTSGTHPMGKRWSEAVNSGQSLIALRSTEPARKRRETPHFCGVSQWCCFGFFVFVFWCRRGDLRLYDSPTGVWDLCPLGTHLAHIAHCPLCVSLSVSHDHQW